jgi:hypothetical protein
MNAQGIQLSLFETRGAGDPFAVLVSERARRLTARVHIGGRVEIVVPVGVKAHTVRDFVQRFMPWIDRKVAAMQCFEAHREPVPGTIEFAFTGEKFAVEWRRLPPRGRPSPRLGLAAQPRPGHAVRGRLLIVFLRRGGHRPLVVPQRGELSGGDRVRVRLDEPGL